MIFSGAERWIGGSFSGGTGRIWLNSMQCRGSERVLIDCEGSFNGSNTCVHAQDVGVRCQTGKQSC